MNSQRHGQGTYTWANGTSQSGDWVVGVYIPSAPTPTPTPAPTADPRIALRASNTSRISHVYWVCEDRIQGYEQAKAAAIQDAVDRGVPNNSATAALVAQYDADIATCRDIQTSMDEASYYNSNVELYSELCDIENIIQGYENLLGI